MSIPKFSLDLGEYAHTAMQYHGGQGTMLYAVGSTGKLECGTIRPRVRCECADGCKRCDRTCYIDLDDRAWFRSLCERLESEACDAADESEECSDEAFDLRRIEAAARAWLDEDEMRTEIIAHLATLDRTPPLSLYVDCEARTHDASCTCGGTGKIPNPDMLSEDPGNAARGEFSRMEIRLRVFAGHWSILTGDSQYDQDHRGACGATSVPWAGDPDAEDYDPAAVADELIDDLDGGEDTEDTED